MNTNDTVTKNDVTPVPPPADDPIALDPAGTSVALAADTRTLSGRVLPFNEPGRTSAGELIFPPGSISIPSDISRVKLLAGHSPHGVPVGVATSWEARDDGVYMTFQLGSTPAADQAIADAADQVVDSFSVEAMGIAKRGRTVQRSLLKAVALVPFPAFANARVATVHASHNDGDPAEADPDLGDGDPATAAPDPDLGDGDPAEADPDLGDGDPATAAPDPDPNDGDPAEADTEEIPPMSRPAVVPSGLTPTTVGEAHASLSDVLDLIHMTRAGEATDAHAALADITASGLVSSNAPAWLGELWNGVTYQRRIVPLLNGKPLTSMKGVGYRWTTKPGVDKYAGDKAAIPSKPAAVEPVEVDAQRWAGGNDLDRKFWDFNETAILESYWRAMAESYAIETDKDAAAFLAANATAIADPASDFIRGVARAGLAVLDATDTPATFALVNPLDVESVFDFAELDAPKYIDLVPVANPANWTTSAQVPRGTAIVGTKSAVDFFELGGAPIRVEAEHIANGGRDAALFGYTAQLLAKPGGIQSVTVGTPAV